MQTLEACASQQWLLAYITVWVRLLWRRRVKVEESEEILESLNSNYCCNREKDNR